MNSPKSTTRTQSCIFVALAISITLIFGVADGFSQEDPFCEGNFNDVCDIETFNNMSLGNHGQSFLSPNGFEFELYKGPGDLRITDDFNSFTHELFFECRSTRVTLPNPVDYVALNFIGAGSTIEFVATDGSGNILDIWYGTGSDATIVTLGPAGDKIERVFIHHADNDPNECNLDEICWEPYIGERGGPEKLNHHPC